MPTPAEVLSIAKIAEYLWNDTIPKEKGFFNGTIDPRKAIQLFHSLLPDLSSIGAAQIRLHYL